MTILHISDTHGLHHKLEALPLTDVIVHSGDITMNGTDSEVADFVSWFAALPHQHKIFVAGNHDKCMYGKDMTGLPDDCHYLCYSSIKIGDVRFYGLPMFKADAQSGLLKEKIKAMPDETDILVSHQPPHGILDVACGVHYGSKDILKCVSGLRPRYHLFGHVHDAYGAAADCTTFVNSSLLDEEYRITNKPQLIKL